MNDAVKYIVSGAVAVAAVVGITLVAADGASAYNPSRGLTVINEKPQEPIFVDECGFLSDSYSTVDSSTGEFHWASSVVTNEDGSFETVTLAAIANEGFIFKTPYNHRVWEYTYTNDAEC